MSPHVRSKARQTGEGWAERKAERLVEALPARVWPDLWRTDWDEPARWLMTLPDGERALAIEEAELAAAMRWVDLVTERRDIEDLEDEELDGEAQSRRLAEAIRPDLPARLSVHCDGPRAYLSDEETGEELTVHSLENAWRVIGQWAEHPR